MINILELKDKGYGVQVSKLMQQLHDDFQKKMTLEAQKWMQIGATVNYSFYEQKPIFTQNDVISALYKLGVKVDKYPGKKWYQFWANDNSVKILTAIKNIPL